MNLLVAKGTVQTRTLRNGKSLQFIYTGRMTADYHQPGTPILGSGDSPQAEKAIPMDDLLVSSAFFVRPGRNAGSLQPAF